MTDVQPPSLSGSRCHLRPLLPAYYADLYELSLQDEIVLRWRNRGQIPPYEAFVQSLHSGVLAQFVVATAQDNRLRGLVVAYNANHRDGTISLGAIGKPGSGPLVVEGVLLLARYVLAYWPFRILHLEVADYNVGQFASAIRDGLLVEEGRLRDAIFFDGGYWDRVILSIARESAERYLDNHVSMLTPRKE
ncbi:MAG: GNAT family N-acetyltransferase [Acidimicrobiales bacterium]